MATEVAVARRRANRAARSRINQERRARREAFQAKVAQRMVVRFYGGKVADLLQLDYRYWQGRRCGWDALADWLRDAVVDAAGNPVADPKTGKPALCPPTESNFWRFWTRLHYESRGQLVTLSNFRVIRGSGPTFGRRGSRP